MSSLGKIRKNAQKFELDNIYKNMTPEEYKNGIRMAVKSAVDELAKEYDKSLNELRVKYEKEIHFCTMCTIDTLSVELLYELAKQLGCFEKDPEFLEDKIYRVQEIYENTMDSIRDYNKYKTDNQARKQFEKKKKAVEKMFNIKF